MCALFKIARFSKLRAFDFFLFCIFSSSWSLMIIFIFFQVNLTFVGGATSSEGGEWLELFSSPSDSEFSCFSLMTGRSSRISVASKAEVFLSVLLSLLQNRLWLLGQLPKPKRQKQ
jgi:hypothetical protein